MKSLRRMVSLIALVCLLAVSTWADGGIPPGGGTSCGGGIPPGGCSATMPDEPVDGVNQQGEDEVKATDTTAEPSIMDMISLFLGVIF